MAQGSDPLNPNDPLSPGADGDGDGLSDTQEEGIGTDVTNPDTDGDGLTDGDEVAQGSDPLDPDDPGADGDGDGLTDCLLYTSPSPRDS